MLDVMLKNILQKLRSVDPIIFLLALLLFGFLLYVRIVGNGFVYDDFYSLIYNRPLQHEQGFLNFFRNSSLAWADYSGIYRPFFTLQLYSLFQVFGFDPFYYHMTSICVHLVNVGLVFWLFHLLFSGRVVPLAAAAFFLVHPIVTEAVAWMTALNNLLGTMYALLSLIFWVLFFRTNVKILYVVSVCLCFVAICTREQFIILPGIFFLFALFVGQKKFYSSLFLTVPYAFTSGVYLLLRYISGAPFSQGVNAAIGQVSFFTAIKALAYSLKLLIVPYPLTVDYDWFSNYNFADGWFIVSVAVIAFSLVLAVCAIRKAPLVALGISWFWLYLFPTSNIAASVQAIFDERFLYFSFIGALLSIVALVTFLLPELAKMPRTSLWVGGSLVLLFIVFAGATFTRLGVWKNQMTLWEDAFIHQAPSYRTHINYARSLAAYRDETRVFLYRQAQVLTVSERLRRQATIMTAEAYLRKGDVEGALTILDVAQELVGGGSNIRFYSEKMRILASTKRYKEMGALASYLLEKYKTDERIVTYQIIAAGVDGDEHMVQQLQTDAANQFLRERGSTLAVAKSHLDRGEYVKVIDLLSPLMEYPLLPIVDPYLWLIEAYTIRGDRALAFKVSDVAAQVDAIVVDVFREKLVRQILEDIAG